MMILPDLESEQNSTVDKTTFYFRNSRRDAIHNATSRNRNEAPARPSPEQIRIRVKTNISFLLIDGTSYKAARNKMGKDTPLKYKGLSHFTATGPKVET